MADDEGGVPSFDNLNAVAHLRQSERYKSVMLVGSCRFYNLGTELKRKQQGGI